VAERRQSALLIAIAVVVVALAIYGVNRYVASASQVAPVIATTSASAGLPPLVAPGLAPTAPPVLTGAAVDLSTVMGRARKLANAWQTEATLLGIEATVANGQIQTQRGATAKLTFGPSPFAAQPRSGLFIVVYDKSGINGAPAPGKAGKALPEPMCAPEGVLTRLAELGVGEITLRYAFDADQRPMWLATSATQPSDPPRMFDPQDCRLRGVPARRKPH